MFACSYRAVNMFTQESCLLLLHSLFLMAKTSSVTQMELHFSCQALIWTYRSWRSQSGTKAVQPTPCPTVLYFISNSSVDCNSLGRPLWPLRNWLRQGKHFLFFYFLSILAVAFMWFPTIFEWRLFEAFIKSKHALQEMTKFMSWHYVI